MKFAISLVVFFLVCRAQARAVEDDVEDRSMLKEQVKSFFDYLTATLEPALAETRNDVEQIIKRVENATTVASRMYYKHRGEIEELLAGQQKGLNELDNGLKYLNVDIAECREKTNPQAEKFAFLNDRLKNCIESNSSKLLQSANKALKALDEAIVVINKNAETAKKCINDATLFTSFSVAKCLTQAHISTDVTWLTAPGKVELFTLNYEYRNFLNKLNECEPQKAYEDFRAKIDSIDREVKNCIIDLVQKKKIV